MFKNENRTCGRDLVISTTLRFGDIYTTLRADSGACASFNTLATVRTGETILTGRDSAKHCERERASEHRDVSAQLLAS